MNETAPPTRHGGALGWDLSIFALALLLRGLHLWQLGAQPFFDFTLGDAASYDAWARDIASGNWLGDTVFYQAPLYPYFLAGIYTALGEDPLLARLAQALIGSFACVLLAHAGRLFFSPRAGNVAGLLLALYAPAVFFDGLLQKSVLDVFLLCLVLWLLGRLATAGTAAWVGLGLALACLVLTRENALLFLPPVLGWLALRRGFTIRQRSVQALLLALGLGAVLVPLAIRNQVVGGELFITTSQAGPNFYIGNNPRSNGSYGPLRFGRGTPEHERRDATEIAERALGRSLTPGEVSRYWTGLAFDYITSQPGDWLLLMARKSALVWNVTEIVDTEDPYTYAEWSTPLRVLGPLLHFGVLAPLALLGVWAHWARRGVWLLVAMALCYAAGVALFYVVARYRYPLVPYLSLFAAAGVTELPRFLRQSSPRTIASAAAAVLAAAVLSNWPLSSARAQRSVTHYNLGREFQARGNPEEAIAHYRRIAPESSMSVLAHNNIGNILLARGQIDDAIGRYAEALRRRPDYRRAHSNMAAALHMRGNSRLAVRHYEEALRIEPDHAVVAMLLARILATHPAPGLRDPARAVSLAEYAAQQGGRRDAVRLDVLAAAYAADGRFPEAVRVARDALDPALNRSPELDTAIRARLALYERSEPFREPPRAAPPLPAAQPRRRSADGR